MVTAKKTPAPAEQKRIEIDLIEMETIRVKVVGKTAFIHNTLSEKTLHELLLPKGAKTAQDKQAALKHIMPAEYRDSLHQIMESASAPTLAYIPGSAFKAAMVSAARYQRGVFMSDVEKLIWVPAQEVPVWGPIRMLVTPVRSADMAKTPDVRTRAIHGLWCAELLMQFAVPMLNARSALNMLANAGKVIGVGDWRPEKGSGFFGTFELVSTPAHEKLFAKLQAEFGRGQQEDDIANMHCYDAKSQRLFDFYNAEVTRRGFDSEGVRQRATDPQQVMLDTADEAVPPPPKTRRAAAKPKAAKANGHVADLQ